MCVCGQTVNCTPSRKRLFLDNLPMTALVRPDSLDYFIGFQSGDVFFYRFGGNTDTLRKCGGT